MRFLFVAGLSFTLLAGSVTTVHAQNINELFRQGYEAQDAGNYEQAEAIWQRVVQLNPNDADAHYNLGLALLEQSQYAEAETAFQSAIRLAPGFAGAHYYLGIAFDAQDKLVAAERSYREAIRLEPNIILSYEDLGNLLLRQERHQEAQAVFQDAIRIEPENAYAHARLGDALFAQERYIAAESAYREAIRWVPNYSSALRRLGWSLERQERYTEAESFFRDAIRFYPEDASIEELGNIYAELGGVLYGQGRYRDAEATFREALSRNNQNVFSYMGLGETLYEQERYPEAEAAYREAVRLGPAYSFTHAFLGHALAAQGRYSAAEASFRESIRLDPDAEDYYNLGNQLLDQGKYEEAITAYREALRLDPEYDVYVNLGLALQEQDRYEEAEAAYQEALRSGSLEQRVLAYNNLGVLAEAEGRYEDATEFYQEAIALDPEYVRAYLNWGISQAAQERFAEAEMSFRQALQLDPNSIGAQLYLGLILGQQGHYQEAATIFEAMTAQSPPVNALGHIGLGALYAEQEQFEAAVAACEAALAILPDNEWIQDVLAEVQLSLFQQQNPSSSSQAENLPEDDPYLSVLRSVVRVVTGSASDFGSLQYGTGWVVKREGSRIWILTNRHVVSETLLGFGGVLIDEGEPERLGPISENVQVDFFSLPPEGETYLRLPARVVEVTTLEDGLDLALLLVEGAPADIRPLTITSVPVSSNLDVLIIGHHDGPWAFARGYISNRPERTEIRIADPNIGKGSSGSPILNEQNNQVVGIITDIEPPDFGAGVDVLGGFGIGHPSPVLEEILSRWGVL